MQQQPQTPNPPTNQPNQQSSRQPPLPNTPLESQSQQEAPPQQQQQPTPDQQVQQQPQQQNAQVMQNQMLQLISQMAASAQDPSTVGSNNAAQPPLDQFQQPAPQVQGQSIQYQVPQNNKLGQVEQQQQQQCVVVESQMIQGQSTQPQQQQTNGFQVPVNNPNQVIQGGINSQPSQQQQQPSVVQQQQPSQQQQTQEQVQVQQPAQQVQVVTQENAQGQQQQQQVQQLQAAPSQQQTMEQLLNAINQLTQTSQQPQTPVAQQQHQQQQSMVQQAQQPQAQIPQYSPAGLAQQAQIAPASQEQQQQQMQDGAAQQQQQPGQQPLQIVDILGQITKSLNTIKQAQSQTTVVHQQPPQQIAQQPQLAQAQQPQAQFIAANQGQLQQNIAQPQQQLLAAQQAALQQPNLNQLVLSLLSNAIQPQQQQPLQQVQAAFAQGNMQAPGTLPPPQPYQHEAMHQIQGGATLPNQQFPSQQTVTLDGMLNQTADPSQLQQPHGQVAAINQLRQSDMASLLQQMVTQQVQQQQTGAPGQQQAAVGGNNQGAASDGGQDQVSNANMTSGQAASAASGNEALGEPQFIKFFVGGVLYSAKEADVEAYFKRFGKVVDVAIMRDKMTGRSRGFAFVTFKERTAEAINVLRETIFNPQISHVIQDRKIEVRESDGIKPADSFLGKTSQHSNLQQLGSDRREKRRDRSPRGSRGGGGADRSSGGAGGQNKDGGANQNQSNQGGQGRREGGSGNNNRSGGQNDSNNNRRRRSRSRDRSSRPGGTSKDQEDQLAQGVRDKVFVGGLDYCLTDQDFQGHFEQFGSVKDAQIVRDPTSGQSRGFGFVTYVDASVAQRLINETIHTKIGGRKVDLRKAELKTSDKIAILNKSSSSGPGPNNNNSETNTPGNNARNHPGQQSSSSGNHQKSQDAAPGSGQGHHHNYGASAHGKKDAGGRQGDRFSSRNNAGSGKFSDSNHNNHHQGGGGGDRSGGRNRQRNQQSQGRSGGNNNSTGGQGNNFSNNKSGASNSNNRGHNNNRDKDSNSASQRDSERSGAGNSNSGGNQQPNNSQIAPFASGAYSSVGGGSYAQDNQNQGGGLGPYSNFERQQKLNQNQGNDSQNHSNKSSFPGSGGLPMTHSISRLFSDNKGHQSNGRGSGNNGRGSDDDGYTRPLGGPEHFGASHANDFGGDFAKVDLDKPLFGAKESGAGGDSFGGGQGQRSLYSSSSAKQQTLPGQEHHASQQKLASKDSGPGQAIRTDMPLASEVGKQQQAVQKPSGHDFQHK